MKSLAALCKNIDSKAVFGYNNAMDINFGKQYRLGVIGCGEMAHAIVEGAIKAGVVAPEQVICSARHETSLEKMRALGTTVTLNNKEVADSEFVLFSVRPQDFSEAAKSVFGLVENAISVMAGIPSAKISEALGGCRVARCMPNLPCRIGYGMSAVDVSSFTEEEAAFLLALFGAQGKAIAVEESKLHAVTGISGSGPAYVYLFIQCLADAGVKEGLTEEEARVLAIQTVIGGAKMAEVSKESLDSLVNSVCSKGGTTIRAVECFRQEGLADIVSHAVSACVERSKELAQ